MGSSTLANTYSGRGLTQIHVGPLKWALFISLFITLSVTVPLVAHQFGAQAGRTLLPMHFFALTAGVVLGWRAGLVVGAASPIVSYLLSGMPSGLSLPILVVEIALYGLIAGLLQAYRGNLWLSLAGATVVGRIALFAGTALLLPKPLLGYVGSVLLVGIPGLALQVLLVPPLSRKLCNWLKSDA